MALEFIKGVKEIGGFSVTESMDVTPDVSPVYINYKNNIIGFKIQDGPIKEVGENGCQLVTLMEATLLILETLNSKFPCVENAESIASLTEAIESQHARTKNRESRGVEGKNEL